MGKGQAQFAIAVTVMALALSACQLAPTEAHTPRIAEASYLSVGGIDQWVTIRGEDDHRPLLLLVHGGPGDAQSAFVATYAPYERDFVLVQWDQRGSGRTFEKYGKATPGLTLDRQVDDGIDLAEQLHKRFPKSRLIVLGHSWGSVIATGMAQKRPDLFAAYVGTGQVSSWAASVNYQFDFLKDEARKTGDAKGLAALEAIGRPDPTNVVQYFTFSRPLRQHMNPSDTSWLAGIKDRALASGESEVDIKAAEDGQAFSGGALIQTLVHQDLQTSAPSIKMPYCVIQGRHDLNAPTDAAKVYFDAISAPKKKFAVIEEAGHFALATHQLQFISDIKACLG